MFNVSMENVQALFQQSQKMQGTNEYLKLKPGVHKIRFCPPWSTEGNPVRFILQHTGGFDKPFKDDQGNTRQPICHNYVFNNLNIGKALFAKNKVTKEDYERWQKFGCIICRFQELMRTSGNTAKFTKGTYLWNVVYRDEANVEFPLGKIYKFNTSKQIFDKIISTFTLYNKLFDPNEGYDFNLTATGEGNARRYPMLMPIPTPCQLGNVKLFDLDIAMADGWRNMQGMIELLNNTYPQVLPMLGIDPAMFTNDNNPPF